MRTTLTIEDAIAAEAKGLAGRRGTSFKSVINQALRIGMRVMEAPTGSTVYRTRTRALELLPGVDPYKLGQVADEQEALEKAGKA